MADTILLENIVNIKVPYFGKNLKNKGDSRSCLFDPRKLLSSPQILSYLGKEIAKIAREKCSGNNLVGMATSGIAWAAVASIYSKIPMLYVRKKLERQISSKYIEGIPTKDKKVILVDDLLFAGESKTDAINVLHENGFKVTDIIVIIDRQIQRKKDGPTLEKRFDLKVHALVTMSEVINYMKQTHAITKKQLENLIEDYRKFERWDMPDFAK